MEKSLHRELEGAMEELLIHRFDYTQGNLMQKCGLTRK